MIAFRKYFLPFLAVAGVGLGILAAVQSARKVTPAPMVSEPPSPPYRTFVAGAGLVEANSENIAIGTQIAGVVARIDVQIGSHVKQGDALFTIDERATRATLTSQKAALRVSESQFEQAKYECTLREILVGKRVISREEAELRNYAADTAAAQVELARAQVAATETELERLTVRAPIDGQVLQIKIHLGEFAAAGAQSPPLLLLGNVDPLCVRVDVDENEAWRLRAGAAATAFLRGNKEIHVPLQFVRFEPYVIPKVSLTGESTERVDTRVLQAIFSFEKGDRPIFIGQQMDVFIDARENVPPAPSTAFHR